MIKILKWKTAEFLFFGFVTFLYFSVNSARSELFATWVVLGFAFTLTGLLSSKWLSVESGLKIPLGFGICFIFLQAAKLAVILTQNVLSRSNVQIFTQAAVEGLFFWLFEGAIFLAAYYVSSKKSMLTKTLHVFIGLSFFLSVNQIIPLVNNSYGYYWGVREETFFHPLIYQLIPLSEYLFGNWCSMNWAGDFISFGIFSGLGVIFYELYKAKEKKEILNFALISSFSLITAINAAVLFLLKSRGSLVFFAAAFLVFLAFITIKWKFRYKFLFLALFLTLFSGFIFWAGNLREAFKEVQTLSEEVKPETQRSWAVNIEGQKRAMRMFEARPLLGIGHGNYEKVSDQFADLGVDDGRQNVAGFTCMSHYFKVLAEQGVSGFIYFLFLFLFVLNSAWNILKSQSQFKFLAGASILCSVLMVLGHASINDIMDRFGMMTLIMISLGILAGLFRKDFDHAA